MNTQWQQYQDILNSVVKPALGCTEPIAAAYASSVAAELLGEKPEELRVQVSDNLYKNSMGVYVPGTGEIGLPIAAAVGAIGGNPDAGLEVLAQINQEQVKEADAFIQAKKVHVKRKQVEEFIYCRVEATAGSKCAVVEISGGHTQIIKKELNGEVVFSQDAQTAKSTGNICDGVDISVEKIYDYALNAEFEDIKFILKAAELNEALSQEGLNNIYGLQVGRAISQSVASGLLGDGLANNIVMRTAAASDARMGGATLPAMSNFGSGNQGIAATMPVVVAAEHFKSSEEQLARALILSHLGAIYIKSHYPPLSAFCGNTVTSAATSMAMVYLAGGSFAQACAAIQNVLSDCSGMICDGAKSTCAMKVKTSTNAAVVGFIMAMRDSEAKEQGIVATTVEQSISNIGKMVSAGMTRTDETIIDIMAA
ncbi:serine dehydratase subunit alpha family protein [Vibrio marisflavi]|uniref:UPF0597 protein VMF7928_01192 n=1 Tax=Vibrio marisflavi CECT 7928 TaxID=634439 RepID=A0ABM9A1F2_9VIBR|nr:L-serine ammonia-lyase, iron-sulfur-dependent, subunit alpha [Vibrio marisflavi]CAH0537599.1 hypothetical protein VMF7928_01192 [Vibrio marisflavi CECT 7928]